MSVEKVTIDTSGWSLSQKDELWALVKKIDSASTEPTPVQPRLVADDHRVLGGWTVAALAELLNRLKVNNGAVQSDTIRKALDNGGEVSRTAVYEMGAYEDGRSLKGFTRPCNRIVKELIAEGLIPEDAVQPLKAKYDESIASYQRAPSFSVPAELVTLWNGAAEEAVA